MNAVFKKLNYKDQPALYVLQSPESFEKDLQEMQELATIRLQLKASDKAAFILIFCTMQSEVDKISPVVAKSLEADGVLWFAYPKGTSKKYKSDIGRDKSWQVLGSLGFEPVRMIAIDADWSALRLRRVEYVKTMSRSVALSAKGKERIKKK